MRARLLFGVIGLLAWPAMGCGGSDAPPFDFAEFDAAMEGFLADNGLEGATAVVVHRDYGMVHLQGYGAFPEDRISLIASSSKVLSVGVLMHLADEGLLDPDASIADYLDAWGEHKAAITTAHLLSNSSGMPGLLDDPLYLPYLCQFVNSGTLASCAETIYTADDMADRAPPDTEFRYGGGQWQLAGGIAEVVSGQTWDELIDSIYVQPCDLEATGYGNHYMRATSGTGDIDLMNGLTYPEFFDGDPSSLEPTDNPNIEGGAYTNAEDYGQILLMHLRGGVCGDERVLSEDAVQRMQQDRIGMEYNGSTIDPTLPGYGLGWWVDRDDPVVADAGAYGATPWLDLEHGYGVMVILEAQATLSASLRLTLSPILEEIFAEEATSP